MSSNLRPIEKVRLMNMDNHTKNGPQTYAIIGAAMAVHRELGSAFPATVYQAALEKAFQYRRVPYDRERRLPVQYRGEIIAEYKADFVCYGEVIVELKAMRELSGNDEAQLINYLKATGLERGLLINFESPNLVYKRLVLGLRKPAQSAD